MGAFLEDVAAPALNSKNACRVERNRLTSAVLQAFDEVGEAQAVLETADAV